MILPFLHTLSKRARLAYPIIQRGVREGRSSRAIMATLQAQKRGIRRQTLLDIMRAEREIERVGSQLQYLRRERFPNPSRLSEAITKIRRRFSFKVRLLGIDTATGDKVEQFVTIATDKLRRRGEIEDIASSFVQEEPDRYPIEFLETLLVGGLRAGPAGVLA